MTFKIGFNPLVAVIVMAVLDPDFRAALKASASDRGSAIEGSGLKLSPAEMMILDSLKPEQWDDLTLKLLNERLTKANALIDKGADIDTGGVDSGSMISAGKPPAKPLA